MFFMAFTIIMLFSPLAGLDYTPIAMNIQFQPGGAEEQRDISIPIINNLLNERDEIFTARLEIPSTETGVILGSTTTTSITIIDDDCKFYFAMM